VDHSAFSLRLKPDGTQEESRICLSAKRASSFKSAAGKVWGVGVSSVDYWQPIIVINGERLYYL